MAPIKLPDLNIGQDTPDDNLRKLMQSIKPHWLQEAIKIKKMSGGYSCSTYHCYLAENPDEGVTARVKKFFLKKSFACRVEGFEDKAVELVSKLGIFPQLLAIFQDGYCYDYIPGVVLFNLREAKDLLNLPVYQEKNLKRIAQKLVSIHLAEMEGEDYSKTDFIPRYLQMLDMSYPDLPDIPQKDIIESELKLLKQCADQLPLGISLCHGDPHPGNMIWHEQTGEITLIDWELASVAYSAFDIAYFLRFFAVLDDAFDAEKRPPKEKFDKMEEQFLHFYYDEWSQKCEPKIDFNTLRNHVKFFKMAYCVIMTVMLGSLLGDEVSDELPMDVKRTINDLMEQYFGAKEKVLQELNL